MMMRLIQCGTLATMGTLASLGLSGCEEHNIFHHTTTPEPLSHYRVLGNDPESTEYVRFAFLQGRGNDREVPRITEMLQDIPHYWTYSPEYTWYLWVDGALKEYAFQTLHHQTRITDLQLISEN